MEENKCKYSCSINAYITDTAITFQEEMMGAALEKWGYCKDDIKNALLELENYRKFGTIKDVEKIYEKNQKKKCIKDSCPDHVHYKCPSCGNILMTKYIGAFIQGEIKKHCENCGQKLEEENNVWETDDKV